MKLFKTIALVLYMAVFILIGGTLITLSLDLVSPDDVVNAVNYISSSQDVKMTAGIVGAIFILVGVFSARGILGKMEREKTIAFDNPDGQVTVSLSAIEDFVKKIVGNMPEVKDFRGHVVASRRGLSVNCKAVLFSDTNIPEITEKVQAAIKLKVQEMLGLEEPINVRINVAKIDQKAAKAYEAMDEKSVSKASRHIPFKGME